MTLKPLAAPIGALLLGGILAAGCGKRASGAGANAFKDAPAEIKAAWDVAWAADQTNGYVPAVLGYKQILVQRNQLSPRQVKAVEDASSELFQRLVSSSIKGDLAAKQALSELQPTRGGQTPPQ